MRRLRATTAIAASRMKVNDASAAVPSVGTGAATDDVTVATVKLFCAVAVPDADTRGMLAATWRGPEGAPAGIEICCPLNCNTPVGASMELWTESTTRRREFDGSIWGGFTNMPLDPELTDVMLPALAQA